MTGEPADKEWLEAYRKGWEGRNEPWADEVARGNLRPPPESPPLSLALVAHFAYLDRLKADIKELDTAASEQRIERARRRLKGGRRDAR
jgi:hypothetical protein